MSDLYFSFDKMDSDKLYGLLAGSFVSGPYTFEFEETQKQDPTEKVDLRFEIQLGPNFEADPESSFTKVRARIFYAGMNRNRVFLTAEAVEQIINSLPMSPIVGEYDEVTDDFTTHTPDTIPYGVISPDNFQWETHTDTDGVERKYASFEIYLWTSRYPISKKIVNKSLSMELDPATVEGEWQNYEGVMYYVINKVNGFAVAVLGDKHEPCFEGAAFYTKTFDEINKEFEELRKEFQIFSIRQGGNRMNKTERELTFKLSFSDIEWKLWEGLNGESYDFGLSKTFDEYALVYHFETGVNYRQYYSVDGDNFSLGDLVEVKILDVTLAEYDKLEALRNSTIQADFETMTENFNNLKESFKEIEEANDDKDDKIANLESSLGEKDEAIKAKDEEIQAKDEELETLRNFKIAKETQEKNELIDKFEAVLPEEDIRKVRENITDFSYDDVEKELAVIAMRNNVNFEKVEVKEKPETQDDDEHLEIPNVFDLEGDDQLDGKTNFMQIVVDYKKRSNQA